MSDVDLERESTCNLIDKREISGAVLDVLWTSKGAFVPYERDVWDYKREFDGEDNLQVAKLACDVLAMYNTRGGYILVGVDEETYQPVGLKSTFLDSKRLSDKLSRYLDPAVSVACACHTFSLGQEPVCLGLILVPKRVSDMPEMMLANGPEDRRKASCFQEGRLLLPKGGSDDTGDCPIRVGLAYRRLAFRDS